MRHQRLALYVTRSPLHIGTGEAQGDIDLPVSRQITTRHPNLPTTAQKRALKDALGPHGTVLPAERRLSGLQRYALFGDAAEHDDGAGGQPHATGMLTPQEAHLLLLPVACGAGGGAWLTSPGVWLRFQRRAALADMAAPALPGHPADDHALCPTNSCLRTVLGHGAQAAAWLVLGPAPLKHQVPLADAANDPWTPWANWLVTQAFGADSADWREHVRQRLVVVPDAVFDSLAVLALGDRARNSVGATVNLWREEAAPEDTVFAGLVGAQPVPAHAGIFANATAALDALALQVGDGLELQMGGNASLGQGFMRLRLATGGTQPKLPTAPANAAAHGGQA